MEVKTIAVGRRHDGRGIAYAGVAGGFRTCSPT
jgi:hypothetical protein